MANRENQLVVVSDNLNKLIEEKQSACPKNFNKTRFLQNCLTALKDIDPEKLARVTPESIALTMVKGAFLGLDFFMGECYAIPFGTELQFLTDYKGDIKLCRQYSIKPIKHIYAELVRDDDFFEAKIDGGFPIVNFRPILFSDKPVIGAFAVVVYDDGVMSYAIMSVKEIQQTRQSWSKCPNSPAWIKAEGEMQKKTVLKRLCKMIELNFDNEDQAKAYQEGADLKRGDEIIDVNSHKVADPFANQKQGLDAQPETPTEPLTPEQEKEAKIDTITAIEDYLISKEKPITIINKYAMDMCKKKALVKYTLAELVELQKVILSL